MNVMKQPVFARSLKALKAGLGIFLVLLGTNCCFLGSVTGAFGAGRHACCAKPASGAAHCGQAPSRSAKSPAGATGCTTVSGAVQEPTVRILPVAPDGPAIAFAAETQAAPPITYSSPVPSTESPPPRFRAPSAFQGRAPPLS